MLKPFVKFWGVFCVLTLALLGSILPGQAQVVGQDSSLDLSRDWTLRAGVYVLNSSTARAAAGDVAISALLERNVYYGRDYNLTVGIGYNGFDRVYSIPVVVNLLRNTGNVRYGFGGGYAFNKRVDGRGANGAVLNVILGYQTNVGRVPLSFDLRYYFTSGTNNELDGYSLTLGYRF